MSRKRSYTSLRHNQAKENARPRLGLPVFLLIAALVLAGAGLLLTNAFSSKTPTPTAGVIDLRADMSGFDKKEIRVKVGEPVTIRLTSLDNSHHTDGGGKHQWAVDDFKASVVALPEGSNTVTFTPDKPGEFTYYCDICCGGRANPTMQGKLIVEA
jgi:heme/copper-type cytochrome/quinol oxidase subunit 2